MARASLFQLIHQDSSGLVYHTCYARGQKGTPIDNVASLYMLPRPGRSLVISSAPVPVPARPPPPPFQFPKRLWSPDPSPAVAVTGLVLALVHNSLWPTPWWALTLPYCCEYPRTLILHPTTPGARLVFPSTPCPFQRCCGTQAGTVPSLERLLTWPSSGFLSCTSLVILGKSPSQT